MRWLCDLVGYGEGSFGLLHLGRGDGELHRDGARARRPPARAAAARRGRRAGAALEGVRVYASDQTHFSIARALDELGFPPETLVVAARRTSASASTPSRSPRRSPRTARAGCTPVAICAVAGSTNTGSVDLVAGARRRSPGARACGSTSTRRTAAAARLSGAGRGARARASSSPTRVTVDPHKWFFQAYDIGGAAACATAATSATTFDRSPEYYRGGDGAGGRRTATTTPSRRRRPRGPAQLLQLGFEGTRRFRALKLWMSWKHLGTSGLGRLVEANLDLAAYLAARMPATPTTSRPAGRARAVRRVLPAPARAARRGAARWTRRRSTPTRTGSRPRSRPRATAGCRRPRLRGSTYLRAGVVNYLTTDADIDRLLATLRRLAAD